MPATPAVSYLRVSTAGQIAGDGFPRQRAAIERYARANRIELLDEFRDEGVSGTNDLEGRPGLSSLIQRIAGNGVRLVLVESASRLARDLMVGEIILAEFRRLGVRVVAVDSGSDLTAGAGEGEDGATKTLIRQILGAVAQFEKTALVNKLAGARRRIRSRGERCDGRKPFGDRPREAESLARMIELRRKPKGKPRRSWATIASTLNAEGRPTRAGGPWKPGSVGAILKANGVK